MLQIEWKRHVGWGKPVIKPYGNFSISPSAIVFHYAIECFEGLKAFKDAKGQIRLFRPQLNLKRLSSSAQRLVLPPIPNDEFLECIKELLKVDQDWVPSERGYSLYIRPTFIGTQEFIGVGPSEKALLYVICCPVGPYYKSGFSAVSLLAEEDYVRAWPGGTGSHKIGGNYAPGILPQIGANAEGFQQILWLHGEEKEITEVGVMNAFIFWKLPSGEKQLLTPSLRCDTILPGVMRDSILALAKQWGEFSVVEEKVTMDQVVRAIDEGRLLEMFGSGTAATIAPIKRIRFNKKDYVIPLDPENPKAQAGPLATRLCDTLMKIQYGEISHEWSVLV